jgi:hypothetical protein
MRRGPPPVWLLILVFVVLAVALVAIVFGFPYLMRL